MTQEDANEIFKGELGKHLDVIHSTSDGNFFVRKDKATLHVYGKNKYSSPLDDKEIKDWYNPYKK